MSGDRSHRPNRLCARDVSARARVDADALALLDEQRDLDHGACLQRGGLGTAARDRVPAQSGVRLADLEIDRAWKLQVSRLAIDEEHLDLTAGPTPAQRVRH